MVEETGDVGDDFGSGGLDGMCCVPQRCVAEWLGVSDRVIDEFIQREGKENEPPAWKPYFLLVRYVGYSML